VNTIFIHVRKIIHFTNPGKDPEPVHDEPWLIGLLTFHIFYFTGVAGFNV